MKISEIYNILDGICPFSSAESWDASGYIYKSEDDNIKKIALAVDCTDETVEKAHNCGANLIICHHPLLFNGIKSVDFTENIALVKLIKYGITAVSCHTNFDIAENGMNDYFASKIGMNVIGDFAKGEHGYFGKIGCFEEKSIFSVIDRLKSTLNIQNIRYYDSKLTINKVATVAGAGCCYISDAARAGVDLLITGDCKYRDFAYAKTLGISLIEVDHYHSEVIFSEAMKKALKDKCNIEVVSCDSDYIVCER